MQLWLTKQRVDRCQFDSHAVLARSVANLEIDMAFIVDVASQKTFKKNPGGRRFLLLLMLLKLLLLVQLRYG